jgi:L-alanine-DL-glutamate epimerase-like enolase superfamily enzyme
MAVDVMVAKAARVEETEEVCKIAAEWEKLGAEVSVHLQMAVDVMAVHQQEQVQEMLIAVEWETHGVQELVHHQKVVNAMVVVKANQEEVLQVGQPKGDLQEAVWVEEILLVQLLD